MIYTNFYIRKYKWFVDIYFNANKYDIDIILDALYNAQCPYVGAKEVYNIITRNHFNTALIYTDNQYKHSIIVICEATSIGQCINSIVHEIRHLQEHIANKYNIPSNSEEVCYIIGNIAENFYYAIKNYIKKF